MDVHYRERLARPVFSPAVAALQTRETMTPFTVCVLAKQALVHVICTNECMALYLANQLRESASISPSDLAIYPATAHETERLNVAGISGDAFLVERVYEDKFFEQLEAQFR